MNLHQVLPATNSVANQREDEATAQAQGYTSVRHGRPDGFNATSPVASLVATCLCTLIVATGCGMFSNPPAALTTPTPALATAPRKATVLNADAQTALIEARGLAVRASADDTLWPSAAALLKQAEAAAAQFDSPLTIKLSREVSALCTASVNQLNYPPVKVW